MIFRHVGAALNETNLEPLGLTMPLIRHQPAPDESAAGSFDPRSRQDEADVWRVHSDRIQSLSVERRFYDEFYEYAKSRPDEHPHVGISFPIQDAQRFPIPKIAVGRLLDYFGRLPNQGQHSILPLLKQNFVHILAIPEMAEDDRNATVWTAIVFQPEKNASPYVLNKALSRIIALLGEIRHPVSPVERFPMSRSILGNYPKASGITKTFRGAGWTVEWKRDEDRATQRYVNYRWRAISPFDPTESTYIEYPCFPENAPLPNVTLHLDHDNPNNADRLFHLAELEKIFGKATP